MKTLNLFLKMHFTSLSPDGQPISLAIVTESFEQLVPVGEKREFKTNAGTLISVQHEMEDEEFMMKDFISSKSFYSEFTDYDINRCDDWVKSNIVSKLNINFKYNDPRHDVECMGTLSDDWKVKGKTSGIKFELSRWLSQFSDYKLNFIVDCGWFTWYKFVELMGEWDTKRIFTVAVMPKIEGFIEPTVSTDSGYIIPQAIDFKIGLPKLPVNFPPVPIDLNDLIMERKGFKSVADAFNVDREILAYGEPLHFVNDNVRFSGEPVRKYNALWDAKVTKAIYEKLK